MDDKIIQKVKQRYGIVGNYEELNRSIDIAIQVAPTELSVLICGESGVGKEVLPRVIHDNSARKHNKYFAINCGSLPEGTIDSELFGHKKGSFTGALDDREGYFGVADNGTLFLDEVGELPLATQARLLRVLETGEYIRVGESEVRKTNVRIVAATNVNMQKAIREGKFREDLYYRLNTIPIIMPPLRERGRDIELLFIKFAYDISEKYRIEPVRLTEDARMLLLKYKWPGNIRQLRNLVEQISIISKEREITSDILRHYGVTDDTIGKTGLVLKGSTHEMHNTDSHSYEKERDMLFQLLSSIGKEVKELKEFVHNNLDIPHSVSHDRYHVIEEDTHPISVSTPYSHDTTLQDPKPYIVNDSHFQRAVDVSFHHESGIQDVDVETVEETPMSNKELMKKNIIDTLKRNNGNRRKAAQELEISERTLFRKIKEYGLNI
ncbi:MAG: sigma-54-dependent Fis family transcriptional regulator [Bacteroidales bacterium]|mgnify:CR=1 FL=1|nr:sigma-54-dependent Fis family transcriptional regulator [Bacteroidales bacterium]